MIDVTHGRMGAKQKSLSTGVSEAVQTLLLIGRHTSVNSATLDQGTMRQPLNRRQAVKVLKIVLILAVLAGLSGCILVPWDGDGDHEHGGGEHHEGRR